MSNLYELTGKYLQIQAVLEADDEDYPIDMLTIGEDLNQKIENYGFIIRNFEAEEEALTSEIKRLTELGFDKVPVCIAKTQYSFTDVAKRFGCPEGFTITIREIVINRGSEFIVAIAGDMMRMPGLPKEPAAKQIDVIDDKIVGLS